MQETNWFHDLTTDDAKEERQTLAQRVIAVLGVICALVLLGLATNAAAEGVLPPAHVYEGDGVSLQLFNAPCESDEAKALAAQSPLGALVDKLQRANSTWLVMPFRIHADFAGCWVEYTHNGKQGYAVAFEDGEIRFFPLENFKAKGQTGV